MSDRLSLWPDKAPWAEVSLSDHPSMLEAMKAFANWSQILKVFGPEDKVKECIALWSSLGLDYPPVESVSFFVTDSMHSDKSGREFIP